MDETAYNESRNEEKGLGSREATYKVGRRKVWLQNESLLHFECPPQLSGDSPHPVHFLGISLLQGLRFRFAQAL